MFTVSFSEMGASLSLPAMFELPLMNVILGILLLFSTEFFDFEIKHIFLS